MMQNIETIRVRGVRESLEDWKARAKKISNKPSKIPISLLKAVYEDEDHVIWNLNYKAFLKAWQEATRKKQEKGKNPEQVV